MAIIESIADGENDNHHHQGTNHENNNAATLKEDSPCWGSPTECDLSHFLAQFSKQDCLVYESPYYIVLNKPPDLRMDGNYPTTVHKVLTLWYPPPSIADDPQLVAKVSTLHQHNSLEDNTLRPCHQLDYATSGLLCVARTREAARFAIRQWEQRTVRKSYLAIVEANLLERNETITSSGSATCSMPQWTPAQIRKTLKHLEKNYKKTKMPDEKKRHTFLGFQPVHAIYQKYKGRTIAANKPTQTNKKKRPRSSDVLTSEQWDYIWEPVQATLAEGGNDSVVPNDIVQVICTSDWKGIESSKPTWKDAFFEATKRHNHFLREALQKEEQDSAVWSTFPTVFGEQSDEGDSSNKVIYISCPLAEDPDAFSMKVTPSLVAHHPHMKPFAGPDTLDYKPSLTKCTILNVAERNGRMCTKVELLPLTGRRHQLRMHMALLAGNGYGIVGDATYNQHTVPLSELRKHDQNARPERMCLHSHRLSLRLFVDDASNKDEPVVDLVAPDPFDTGRSS
jgi:23S rRNA-/tRNA-specific pseudouridylate synthase